MTHRAADLNPRSGRRRCARLSAPSRADWHVSEGAQCRAPHTRIRGDRRCTTSPLPAASTTTAAAAAPTTTTTATAAATGNPASACAGPGHAPRPPTPTSALATTTAATASTTTASAPASAAAAAAAAAAFDAQAGRAAQSHLSHCLRAQLGGLGQPTMGKHDAMGGCAERQTAGATGRSP